jgi:hypothetical protein
MTRVLYIVIAGLLLAESLCSFGLGIALASSMAQAGSDVIKPLGFLGLLGGLLLTASAAVAVPRLGGQSWTRIIALISFFYGTWGLLKGAPPHLQYALPEATGGLGAVLCSLGFVAIGGLGIVVLLMERRNSPDISEVS